MNETPVPGQVAHFSINVDNMERAQKFYSNVFGWKFHAYGPPGFYMVEMTSAPPAPLIGSIQGRRPLGDGEPTRGFECTVAVADVDATIRLIEENGGKILMSRVTLPTIGHLCFFEDTEGTKVGAMQYDTNAQ